MKPWRIFIAAAILAAAGCNGAQPPFQDPFTRPQIAWRPKLTLDVRQAGRILGDTTHLEKVSAYLDGDNRAYQASYRADQPDPATGKTGVLGYRYEEYPGAEAARSSLVSTLQANRLDPRDAIRTDSGAELHYFTGGTVVRMFMLRKENRLVVVKVNPVTSHYSQVELRKVAAELAAWL
jgi:hypothetical protein